jgi:hypothetical protein
MKNEYGKTSGPLSSKTPHPIVDKMVEHQVDLTRDCDAFRSTLQYVELDLYKDGRWFCSYLGYLATCQIEELRASTK